MEAPAPTTEGMDDSPAGVAASREVLGRGRGLWLVAVACVAIAVEVAALARPGLPAVPALIALAVQGAIAAALAWSADRAVPSAVRVGGQVAVAGLTAVPIWFFGPLGSFVAVLALALVLAGLAAEPPSQPRAVGWAIYGALALAQAVVFALEATGAVADRSLVPVLVPGHPAWHAWMAEAALQGVGLAAFVAGRAAARRYRRLAADLDATNRDVARQDALLAEARADYARAVDIARQGAVAPAGPRALGPLATGDGLPSSITVEQASVATVDERGPIGGPPTPIPTPPSSPAGSGWWVDPAGESAWDAAYRAKMRYQDAAVLALCIGGGLLITAVTPVAAAWIAADLAIVGIIGAFLVRRWLLHRDATSPAHTPWIAVAALAAGPSYSWGVHSGFAAVIATFLFAASLFPAPRTHSRERFASLVAVMVSQGALFGLIVARVVPDASNLKVLPAGVPVVEAYVQQAAVQLTFVAAFLGGVLVDRRFAEAFRRVDAARREVVRGEARVRETRAEIDLALRRLGGGLFTGTTVQGHAVGRLLGRGGMGEVYEAVDPTGVRVALKLLRPDRAGDPGSLARFTAEADVLTHVDSRFVARVLSVGRDAGELPFITMTYVEGRSLARLLRDRVRLAVPGVASLVRDVGRGLQDVHAAGFVHLDVKPSNILLADEEMGSRWCLVDFGVARLTSAAAAGIAGTPQYMAPEQARGGDVDARADLYSLCLVVYRALTGRPAFAGTDRVALAEAARRGPPDPRRFAPIGDDVALVLRVGLAADPGDRWASAFELRAAFDRAVAGTLSDEQRARAQALLARAPWAPGDG